MPNQLTRAKSASQLIQWRRDFHSHPELSYYENRTAARIAEILQPLGFRLRTGLARTGLLADLGQGKPVFAIRADMDALPIQETNEIPYISREPGVMHACGHDAHIAMTLGAATLLAGENFPGTLRFIFQPAEEESDEDGISGAVRMIQEGALEGVNAILALHVDASLPVGQITITGGPDSAGVDTFYATILGQGGHGAAPHKVVDPIYLAGHVILALHGIVSRRLPPFEPAVVSIGSIHAGSASNIIPDKVELVGTIRFMTRETQQKIHTELERCLQVARTLGGDYKLTIEIGYPPMINNESMADLIRSTASSLLGADNVLVPKKEMGSEDFSFYLEQVPGAMFCVGCRLEGSERRHHSPNFDLDENCLPVGAAVLAETALRYLKAGIRG